MSFDRLAPHYRWMEFVLAGSKLQVCRTAFLNTIPDVARILLLGEGNGRFLTECQRRFPAATITCIDASSAMLARAQARLKRYGLRSSKVEFLHRDALEWSPPERAYGLIATHFFLDCFRPEQLESIIQKCSFAAAPGAAWLLADFRIPSHGLGRWRARIVHWMMYAFFRVATKLPARSLTPPDPFLKARGFKLKDRRIREWGLVHTDFWQKVATT